METADADTMMRPRGFFLVALLVLEVLSERKSFFFFLQSFSRIIASKLKTSLFLYTIDTENNFLSRSPSPTPLPKRAPARAEQGNPHPPPPTTQRAQNSVMNKTLRSRNAPRAPLLANGLPLAPATEETRVRGLRAPTPYRRRSHHTAKFKINAQSKKQRSFRDESQKQKKKKKTVPKPVQ